MKHTLLIPLLILTLAGCAPEPAPAAPLPTATLEHCVDLNTANGYKRSGEHLPGITPDLAWAIAEYIAVNGPFETVDDLANVDGITAETVAGLRAYVCKELSQ